MSISRTERRQESGAVMLESVIVFPLLLLFIFGIVQYSLVLGAQITLHNTAAFVARMAAVEGSGISEVTEAAKSLIQPLLDPDKLVAELEEDQPVAGAKKVTLRYEMPVMFSFIIPQAVGGNLELIASGVMK